MVTNKIFDLIDCLLKNRDTIERYSKVIERKRNLENEVYRLKPKNQLEDDSAYEAKKRELDNFVENSEKAFSKIMSYSEKIESLSFKMTFGTYKNDLTDILIKWLNSVTDKDEAKKQLQDYRQKYKKLQSDKAQLFLTYLNGLFFSDLDFILKETFSTYLKNPYEGISLELKLFLENGTDEIIERIIVDKELPPDAQKPKWKRNVDAVRFGRHLGLSNRQLRDLFDNDVRSKNEPPENDKNDKIKPILQKYLIPETKD